MPALIVALRFVTVLTVTLVVGVLNISFARADQGREAMFAPVHLLQPPLIGQDEDSYSAAICLDPPNPIVTENCLPGSDSWHIDHYTPDIVGFASSTSLNLGETIDLFINTDAPTFDIYLYRSGYYQGTGGRLLQTISDLPGQNQPVCHKNEESGLASCSNWTVSHRLEIPADWVSGVYLAKLVRPDTGGENFILFTVRDDGYDSAILMQLSVTTYQAYNNFGGKSVYNYNSGHCATDSGHARASAISFQRPYLAPAVYSGNTYFWSDYPMVFWLEAQGYDVSYATNLDVHRYGKPHHHNGLLHHHIFLSVGHDEYWSQAMRDAITQARDAGVHLGFFSANTGYWRVQLEPDPWTGEPDQVMLTYKSADDGVADPSGHSTSTWRDPNGVDDPENGLIGVQYIGDNDRYFFPLRVTSEAAQDHIFRYTGLQEMPPDSYVDIGSQLVGWEWDAVVDNGHTPPGLVILAESPVNGELLVDAGSQYDIGEARAHTTRYVAESGAIVFASGTNLWAWGLSQVEPNPIIQQITANLLADMGAQPATPAKTLVLDGYPAASALARLPQPAPTRFDPAPTDPKLIDIQLQPGEQSVTVSWQTDVPTTSQLWVTKSANLKDKISIDLKRELATSHRLEASGLTPGHTYHYFLISTDAAQRTTIHQGGVFETDLASLKDRVKNELRSTYHAVQCQIELTDKANPLLWLGLLLPVGTILGIFVIYRVGHR